MGGNELFFYDNSTFRTVKLPTESDFEDILIQLQSQIFPNFFLFETKKSASTPYGERTHADMCLVSKTCEQWFIIEVELQKGDRYSKNHIRNQLSKQVEADWTTIISEIQEKLKDLNVKRSIYSRLERVDWGNMLVIDEASEATKRICNDYGVVEVEINTLMNQRGDYSLRIHDHESIPIFVSDRNETRVFKSKNIRCVAGILYLSLPIKMLEQIQRFDGKLKLLIDDEIMILKPNLKGQLEIPVHLTKLDCLTRKLARKVVDAGIQVMEDEGELIYLLNGLENW